MLRAWTDRGTALLLGALVFVTYALGASRTIFAGDSGELVAAVHVVGIPHPSGYPLYVILGKLWTLAVPIGSIAFRMSLFSAACGAAAAALAYLIVRRVSIGQIPSLFAALLFAFGSSYWSEANIQRVYTLNALFVALATWAAIRWWQNDDRSLVLAFFFTGLGAANHTFMLVFAIALALTVLITRPSVLKRWRLIAASLIAFCAGLLPYSYLPIRSRMNPRLDWGNPETLDRFLEVVLRREYWDRKWIEGPADLWPVFTDWAWSLGTESAWCGLVLAALASATSLRLRGGDEPRKALMLLALATLAGNVGSMALHGSRSDLFIWHRYYIPSYLMIALLAAIGLDHLIRHVPRFASSLVLLVPLTMVAAGYRSHDRSGYRIADDFSRTLLRTLPPGATLLAGDDNILFPLLYLKLVERLRPDVQLVSQGVAEAVPSRLSFNPDEDPIFFTHHPNWNVPGLQILPQGMVYRAWRAGRVPPPATVGKAWLDGERDPRVPKDYLTQNLVGHFHYMRGITLEAADFALADQEFQLATQASPDNDVLFYNLGLIYARNGLYDRARTAFLRASEIDPRGIRNKKGMVVAADTIAALDAETRRIAAVEAELLRQSGVAPRDHQRMAALLEARGELAAARGHLIRSGAVRRQRTVRR